MSLNIMGMTEEEHVLLMGKQNKSLIFEMLNLRCLWNTPGEISYNRLPILLGSTKEEMGMD